jgi:hypothetical protein
VFNKEGYILKGSERLKVYGGGPVFRCDVLLARHNTVYIIFNIYTTN